jgi:chlorobactene glucosyltransferase
MLAITAKSNARIDPAPPDAGLPFLSIVVPARNEERQIEPCVRSLLAQAYPNFEVIAVDDQSNDATLAILERLAAADSRLRLVNGVPLPPDWVGKPWALIQGARAARGDWLLFTDADTVHDPRAAACAVRYALERHIQFLSLLPTQRFASLAERALLPSILLAIAFAVGSLDAINDPRRLDAAIFNGQYLLCERTAYHAIGSHETVRGSLAEDYDFARAVKRDGRFVSCLADSSDLVRTRMYRSAAEIWQGFTKNLYVGVRQNPAQAAAGIALFAALSPLPEWLLLRAARSKKRRSALLPALCIAASSAAAEIAARRSRYPAGSGLFFPVGTAAMVGIFANSIAAHLTGRVAWRGRTYGGRA